jgi:glycosyltransferase involved in cell wall biosynthesis
VAEQPLRILQVNMVDTLGGAARVAWNLHQAYLERGLHAWMAVGWKLSDDPNVLLVPNDDCRNQWARIWSAIGNVLFPLVGKVPGLGRLRRGLQWIGQPRRLLEILRGYEDFDFPGTWRLLDLPTQRLEIVHCHNLHGGYFDLEVLPWLSQQVPVIMTFHDAWLLSGHCGHSLDCERWKTGCGFCPYLTIPPAIRRDETAFNWRRKQAIYVKSRLHVVTPSQWLMQKVDLSMLAPAMVEARVIPNGVDLSIFHPADRRAVRAVLGVPQDARVLLFTAINPRQNIWKDYQTMQAAIARIVENLPGQRVLFISLGEDAPAERIGQAEVRFIPYQKDPRAVARYYQAADVYVHSARAETFPNTVLEALACGTPVVATAVGGIPEQVRDGATGFLVPPEDAETMAKAILMFLTNDALRTQLGYNAAQDAKKRFGLSRQVDAYLEWYRAIVERQNMERSPFQPATMQ